MSITYGPICSSDRQELVDLFNAHVVGGFAAYPESLMPYAFFDQMMAVVGDYPTVTARSPSGQLLGFGFLRPWNPLPAFSCTAEVTYFLRSEVTRQGIGGNMLARLQAQARARGITSILANISSLNENSIRFHLKNGFVECGRFIRVARKNGKIFDAVWMQKQI